MLQSPLRFKFQMLRQCHSEGMEPGFESDLIDFTWSYDGEYFKIPESQSPLKETYHSVKISPDIQLSAPSCSLLLTIAKLWKQCKCSPMDDYIKKLWHAHTIGNNSAGKKKATLPCTTTWMNLKGIRLSDMSVTGGQLTQNSTYMRCLK